MLITPITPKVIAKPIAASKRTEPKDKPKKVVLIILFNFIFLNESCNELLASILIFSDKESSSTIFLRMFTISLLVLPAKLTIALNFSVLFPNLAKIEFFAKLRLNIKFLSFSSDKSSLYHK